MVKNLCKTPDAADREELRAILDRQRFFARAGDRDDFSRQDSAFHMAMYRMAGVEGLWRNVRAMQQPAAGATLSAKAAPQIKS